MCNVILSLERVQQKCPNVCQASVLVKPLRRGMNRSGTSGPCYHIDCVSETRVRVLRVPSVCLRKHQTRIGPMYSRPLPLGSSHAVDLQALSAC